MAKWSFLLLLCYNSVKLNRLQKSRWEDLLICLWMLEGNDRITLYLQSSTSSVVMGNLVLSVIPCTGCGHKILSGLLCSKVGTLGLFLCQLCKTQYRLFKCFRQGGVTADSEKLWIEKVLDVVLHVIQVMFHDGGNKRCAIKKREVDC